MVAQVDPANPDAEPDFGIFDQLSGIAGLGMEDATPQPEDAATAGEAPASAADSAIDDSAEAALAALAASEDTDAVATVPEAAPEASASWWETEEGRNAHLSEYRRKLEEDILNDLDKGLSDPEARKNLNARKRRFVNKHDGRAQAEAPAASANDPAVLAWYARHDHLLAARQDRFTWADLLADDADAAVQWVEMVKHKADLGLPETATAAQVRQRVAELDTQHFQDQTKKLSAATDPDALYDRFMERAEFAQFSDQQRADLLPDADAFKGIDDPATVALAMTERFGEFAAYVRAKAARDAKIRDAGEVNGTAQKAQAAAQTAAPAPAGSAVGTPLDEATLARQFREAIENDTLTPELEAAMYRIEERRNGGSGWV